MPRDINGNFTLVAGNPVVSGTPIESNWANTTMSDIALAMTESLSRTGEGGMLVPLRFVDGGVSDPAISFTNEPTSGIYRAGSADVRMSIAATDRMRWTATGVQLWNPDSSLWGDVLDANPRLLTAADDLNNISMATGGGSYYWIGGDSPANALRDATSAMTVYPVDADNGRQVVIQIINQVRVQRTLVAGVWNSWNQDTTGNQTLTAGHDLNNVAMYTDSATRWEGTDRPANAPLVSNKMTMQAISQDGLNGVQRAFDSISRYEYTRRVLDGAWSAWSISSYGAAPPQTNHITNGALQEWQRGNTITNPNGGWVCDMCRASGFTQVNRLQRGIGAGIAEWVANLAHGGGTSVFDIWVPDGRRLYSNRECVFSYRATATDFVLPESIQLINTARSVVLKSAAPEIYNGTINGELLIVARFPAIEVNADPNGSNGFYVRIGFPASSATAWITEFKLEDGDHPTKFELPEEGDNRTACDRWYQRFTAVSFTGVAYTPNGDTRSAPFMFPTPMASAPAFLNVPASINTFWVGNLGDAVNVPHNFAFEYGSGRGFSFSWSGALPVGSLGQVVSFGANAFDFQAEVAPS